MALTGSKKLDILLKNLGGITDPEERSMVLIGYAERFREVVPQIARRPFPDDNRVPFCESEAYVWLNPLNDGRADLSFAVENPSGISAKALATILTETLSGSTLEVLSSLTTDLVTDIFRENISMGKGMGLMGMIQMVRTKAEELAQQRKLQRRPPNA